MGLSWNSLWSFFTVVLVQSTCRLKLGIVKDHQLKKKTPNNEKLSVRFIWKRYQACSYTDVNNHARSGVIPPSYSHAFDADWMWSHIKQRSLYFELYYKPRGSAQAMARSRLFGRPFSGNGLLLDSAVYMACYSLLWMLKKIPLHFYITACQ